MRGIGLIMLYARFWEDDVTLFVRRVHQILNLNKPQFF